MQIRNSPCFHLLLYSYTLILYYTLLLPARHICPPDSHILLRYISRWAVSHHHNHHLLLYAHICELDFHILHIYEPVYFVSSTPFAIIHLSQAGVSTGWTYMSASYTLCIICPQLSYRVVFSMVPPLKVPSTKSF